MAKYFRETSLWQWIDKIDVKSTSILSVATALFGSCLCPLQLALNAMGFGCAGFAVLTPYRVPFGLFTVANIFAGLWMGKKSNQQALLSVFSLSILFSPEIVKYFNRLPFQSIETEIGNELHFSIEGVKCEACANRLKNLVSEIEGVQSVAIFFDESRGYLQSKTPIKQEQLDKQLDESGFELKIKDRITNVTNSIITSIPKSYSIQFSDFGSEEDVITLNQYLSKLEGVIRVNSTLAAKSTIVTSTSELSSEVLKSNPLSTKIIQIQEITNFKSKKEL